jgi:hypothetical protein
VVTQVDAPTFRTREVLMVAPVASMMSASTWAPGRALARAWAIQAAEPVLSRGLAAVSMPMTRSGSRLMARALCWEKSTRNTGTKSAPAFMAALNWSTALVAADW